MNLAQFKRILLQAFLLPVVALLVTAAALYWQFRGSNATVDLIQKADARIAQTALIARLMVDEESGLRGYETTSDPRFLEPFNDAERHLDAEFEKLDALAGKDAAQRSAIEDLRNQHQTWRDAFALPVIATVRAGGATSDVELNLYGKSLMERVRQDIGTIIRMDEGRRSASIAQWHQQGRHMLEALVVIALSMGVLIGLFTRNRLHAVSAAYRNSLEVLGRRAEEIFQSEQRLRTTLVSIGDGVITCDAQGRIQMMNPVACELTGWDQAEATDRPLGDVFRIVDEVTREPLVATVMRLDGAAGVGSNSVLVRKDGTQLIIADSGAPIRDHTGATAGIVLVFRDITRERRTQEALLANEKLAVAGRLAAAIAHEIHNPLDSVANLLYLMRNGCSEEESRLFMDMAGQELARVTQISRAMLGLYRESKAPVGVSLTAMLEETLLLMEHRFVELGVKVHSELPETVEVEGFPAELRQVFTNLITNAAEAASPGGEVRIRLSGVPAAGQKTSGGAQVTIADSGPGIPAEVRPHLFQPFFTTKGEHGTGLGLWVSRGIINKHGGSIEIASNPDGASHGTTVTVILAAKPSIGTVEAEPLSLERAAIH